MSGNRKNSMLLILVVLAVIAATLFSFMKFAENRDRQEAYSSFTTGEKGYYGAYKLLTMTYPGRIHQEISPLMVLLKQNSLIITARIQWSRRERQLLERWMKRGGILVNLNPSDSLLGDYASERSATLNPVWKGFSDLPKLDLPAGQTIQPSPERVPIYRSADGPEIVVERVGKGRQILFADVLKNSDLKKHPEAAAVLAKIVGIYLKGRPDAAWDEGAEMSDTVNLRYSGPIPIEWFAILGQLALLAILYSLMRGWRFGKPIPLNPVGFMSLKDYLHSLAGFYFKAGAGNLALEELTQDLRRRLSRATGLSVGVGDDRLVTAYENIYHKNPQPLRQLLKECENAIARRKVSERQLVHYGRMIENFRREIDRYGFER